MSDILIHSQAEWNEQFPAHRDDEGVRFVIDSPAGVWLTIDSIKAKAPSLTVLREVDIDGQPLTTEAVR